MWMPRPSSPATASASAISRARSTARCLAGGAASTPIVRSKRRSASPAPSRCRAREQTPRCLALELRWPRPPRRPSSRVSSGAVGRRQPPASPRADRRRPSAAHSASIRRLPAFARRAGRSSARAPRARARLLDARRGGPRRGRAPSAPCARSTRRSRSRSSASWSAEAERARSSASAASAATVRSGPSSSGENARRSWVVAIASTAITRSPATSGTKAALRAPIASGDRLVDERRGRPCRRRSPARPRTRRSPRPTARSAGRSGVAPVVEVHALAAREQAAGLAELVVDEDETDELRPRTGRRSRRARSARPTRRRLPGRARPRPSRIDSSSRVRRPPVSRPLAPSAARRRLDPTLPHPARIDINQARRSSSLGAPMIGRSAVVRRCVS